MWLFTKFYHDQGFQFTTFLLLVKYSARFGASMCAWLQWNNIWYLGKMSKAFLQYSCCFWMILSRWGLCCTLCMSFFLVLLQPVCVLEYTYVQHWYKIEQNLWLALIPNDFVVYSILHTAALLACGLWN